MAKGQAIAYLKIDGIPGSSIKKGFEEQISVYGYEHIVARAVGLMHEGSWIPSRASELGSRLGNPREAHTPFIVHKVMDRATVLLLQALDQNKTLKDPVEVSILQSVLPGTSGGGGDLVAMKIALTGTVVQSVHYRETGDEGTVERIGFAYSGIEYTFQGLDEAGKRTGSLSAKISLERP
jgi:type VI secretion system Hcp family effector